MAQKKWFVNGVKKEFAVIVFFENGWTQGESNP